MLLAFLVKTNLLSCLCLNESRWSVNGLQAIYFDGNGGCVLEVSYSEGFSGFNCIDGSGTGQREYKPQPGIPFLTPNGAKIPCNKYDTNWASNPTYGIGECYPVPINKMCKGLDKYGNTTNFQEETLSYGDNKDDHLKMGIVSPLYSKGVYSEILDREESILYQNDGYLNDKSFPPQLPQRNSQNKSFDPSKNSNCFRVNSKTAKGKAEKKSKKLSFKK